MKRNGIKKKIGADCRLNLNKTNMSLSVFFDPFSDRKAATREWCGAEAERGQRSEGAEGRSEGPERRAEAERGQQSEGAKGLSEGTQWRAERSEGPERRSGARLFAPLLRCPSEPKNTAFV